ncbi:MAG: hypothetical protein ACXAB9_13340, partial [Candidatus Thorarchaeota archaeon]
KCIHIPALRVDSPTRGILMTGTGIADFILPHLAKQIAAVCCPNVFAGYRSYNSHVPPYSLIIEATYTVDAGCYCKKQDDEAAAWAAYNQQKAWEKGTLTFAGGKMFPQGVRITLESSEGARIIGKFNGTDYAPSETFIVHSYKHPQLGILQIPPYIGHFQLCTGRVQIGQYSNGIPIYDRFSKPTFNAPRCTPSTDEDQENTGWNYVSSFPRADFYWIEPGTEFYQVTNEGSSVHVVNLLPSTILRVAAWKQHDLGIRQLATVPNSYYSTRVSDFNGYMVQEIVLNKPMRVRGEGWEGDELYVSFNSSVGPNPVDMMTWLIDKYTDLTWDATTFNDVKTKLTVYHNAYPILDRRNIIDVLKTIAFNNRCALILRNGVFKLIYLSEEPTSVDTITEADIVPKSLRITHTPTEDLATQVTGTWRDDYAYDEKKYISRFNVKKYGFQKTDFEFMCFNIYKWVVKSNTFWMIRTANTWKKLKFKTFLERINLEVLDCVTVNLPKFSPVPVKCIVEQATYNKNDNTIEFDLWTPIRSGELTPFDFAWPANISTQELWPSRADIEAGFGGSSGPNIDVRAPSTHALNRHTGTNGFNLKDTPADGPCETIDPGFRPPWCRPDHGDSQPSDIDDQPIDPDVPGAGETKESGQKGVGGVGTVELQVYDAEAQVTKTQDQLNGATALGTKAEGGDQVNDPGCKDSSDPEWPDDEEVDDDCAVVVYVGWLNPCGGVFQFPGPILTREKGEIGFAVQDQTEAVTERRRYVFNSLKAAQAFHDNMRAMAASPSAVVGMPWPAISSIFLAINTWGPHCEEPTDEDGNSTGGQTGSNKDANGGRKWNDDNGNDYRPDTCSPMDPNGITAPGAIPGYTGPDYTSSTWADAMDGNLPT